MPSRGGQIGGCGTIIVIVLIVAYYLLSGGQGLEFRREPAIKARGRTASRAAARAARAAGFAGVQFHASRAGQPPATRPGRSCSIRMPTIRCWNRTYSWTSTRRKESAQARTSISWRRSTDTGARFRAMATGPLPGDTTSRRTATSTMSDRKWCRTSAKSDMSDAARRWWISCSGRRRTIRPITTC